MVEEFIMSKIKIDILMLIGKTIKEMGLVLFNFQKSIFIKEILKIQFLKVMEFGFSKMGMYIEGNSETEDFMELVDING